MLVTALCHTILNLYKQQHFLRQFSAPVIKQAMLENDGSLDETDINKIQQYYGLAVPAVLGEAFCRWQGRKMTGKERRCSTSQGAMTGLFDDFFDKQFMNETHIQSLMNSAETDYKKPGNEKLFTWFFRQVLTEAPDQHLVGSTLQAVYDAQVESKKQADINIPVTDIRRITYQKGGASLLFYRSAFYPPADEAEQQLLYRFGGLMQWSNDIFDVYKDREAGIQTLVTTAGHIRPMRVEFLNELKAICRDARASAGNPKRAEQFLSLLILGIFSRVLVCLDQLETLEWRSGGQFDLKAYSRKDLICDMDTWKNRWRSARYYMILMR